MAWPFKKEKILDMTKNLPVKKLADYQSDKMRMSKDPKEYGYIKVNEEINQSVSEVSNNTALPQNDTLDTFGFFNSVAESSSNSSAIAGFPSSNELDLKDLKVKVEDFDYKMDNLSRKLNNLLERLDLIEQKLNRGRIN